jgi:Glycosyltransferase family 87
MHTLELVARRLARLQLDDAGSCCARAGERGSQARRTLGVPVWGVVGRACRVRQQKDGHPGTLHGGRAGFTPHRRCADETDMAHAVPHRPFAGAIIAFRRLGALVALAALPLLLALAVIGGAIGHRYAFDFHGGPWSAAHAVLHGSNPYPAATAAGLEPGNRFVYPPVIALLFLPLGALPFPVAAALLTIVLIAAMAATLYVLGVRDWRCYGATFLSIAVLHDIRLGALTPLLALGVALGWQWRDRARAAIPLALVIVAKLFLWPLLVWLLATGRVRVAGRTVVYAVGACAVAWATIGFAGLADYPRLLRVVSEVYEGRGYSLVSAGLALGLGSGAARGGAIAIGLVLLACCARVGRRGDDRRSLILALAATLALSPIVWLHYFVLLLVPIALARRSFALIWLIPALFWITPYEEHFGAHWRIAVGIGVAVLALGASWRRPGIVTEM